MDAVQTFLTTAQAEFDAALKALDLDALNRAADMICRAKAQGNRLHVTGIGKPGHIAGYLASLFSSTGTPAYFLHGTEAVHGSCGQLVEGTSSSASPTAAKPPR